MFTLISGYVMMLGNGCFSWSSKKQTTTALSTGEGEYYATVHTGHEVNWVQQLLAEIEFSSQTATTLCINNTSSIHMIETPDQFTNWTKHINIAYHWIHEEVQKQTMCLLTIIYLISSPKDSMHHVTKNLLVHLEWVLGLMLVEGQC